ncbi:hypothetical protein KRP22_009891 [Phytophthora ramorum]|nr:hypothetical protein KRP22_10064 [Phytophthora ramorum]
MRLSNFVIVAAAVAGLVASGNALSPADYSKVSEMASPDTIKAVQHYGGNSKRSLRVVESADENADDDNEEERINWTSVAKHFPGTAAKKAADAKKEESIMAKLAPAFADYNRAELQPLDVYRAMRKEGFSKTKAMEHGNQYEAYLRSLGLY